MGNYADQLSKKTNGVNAIQRIGDLEKNLNQVVKGADALFQQADSRLKLLEETVSALVTSIGVDEIAAIIEKRKSEQRAEQNAKLQVALDAAVTEGKLAVSNLIGPDTIVVGVERNHEGHEISPHVQVPFNNFLPEFRAELEGKHVGAVVATKPVDSQGTPLPTGTFEILGVYQLPPSAPETHAEQVAVLEGQ